MTSGNEFEMPPLCTLMPRCSLIVDDQPLDGATNMQIDAALLETSLKDQECIVRIYGWSEPTVSLGHFQRLDSTLPPALQGLPVVRRLTGGGAILHDRELTYSVTVPVNHPLHHNPTNLYRIVHRLIIQLLSECGCIARLRSDAPPGSADALQEEPFLCFLRQDPNDIVCDMHITGAVPEISQNGTIEPPGSSPRNPSTLQSAGASRVTQKIVGSAQRRRRGTVLQHGSVLLQHSERTPDVPGICDLYAEFRTADFSRQLPVRLAQRFAETVQVREYHDSEIRRTAFL